MNRFEERQIGLVKVKRDRRKSPRKHSSASEARPPEAGSRQDAYTTIPSDLGAAQESLAIAFQ